ncbi:CDP-glycerol glycerophosphotransferase family protein, partial [Helicobacter burdigaliensis]|uniref:CDP-glycerol glycerophosphotransferase family protein n=1 Tax=Helicobacter burdigaliensis TaxID=2315334 RepID=UPI0018E57821
FLQHGVTHNDVSSWLNQRKIDLFITSTKNEYHSIVDNFNHYKFGYKELVLTGMPRHDALIKNNKSNTKQILIMPTWRQYLSGEMNKYNTRSKNKNFMNSEYFLKWKELLQSQELRDIADNYGYKIVFNPHPQVKIYIEDFKVPDYIIIGSENRMQELFCNSSLMITDYSSVAFEMAYLNKPVIYYQFDKEVFFANHTLQQGYFNYEEDGFGPVVKTQEGLLKEAKKILEDGCKVGEPYKTNMANTFLFRDGKCCERVYE